MLSHSAKTILAFTKGIIILFFRHSRVQLKTNGPFGETVANRQLSNDSHSTFLQNIIHAAIIIFIEKIFSWYLLIFEILSKMGKKNSWHLLFFQITFALRKWLLPLSIFFFFFFFFFEILIWLNGKCLIELYINCCFLSFPVIYQTHDAITIVTRILT